jgi:hypothetical protein
MTVKYHRSDDGSIIDGKTIVFLPVAKPAAEAAAPIAKTKAREQAGVAQAAALVAAAKDGVPFCEECEKARKALAARK